jgi:hypothetical protein
LADRGRGFDRQPSQAACSEIPGPRRVELSCDPLEERVTPSHPGTVLQLAAAVHVQPVTHHSSGTTSTLPIPEPRGSLGNTAPPSPVGSTHGVGRSHSTNSALQTALQTLKTEVLTIESKSGTTIGQLTTINLAFKTLARDGLVLSSRSALSSFENNLVKAYGLGTTMPSLSQFEMLYTSSTSPLTPQQTMDLTTAYNDLAAAVTSSNIISAPKIQVGDWRRGATKPPDPHARREV